MFGIGGWEFLLIAALALMLFGPDKLPEFARTIGRLVRDFKRYQDLMESTIRAEMYSTETKQKPDAFKKGKEFRERVQAGEYETADDEAEAGDGAEAGDDAEAGDGAEADGTGAAEGDVAVAAADTSTDTEDATDTDEAPEADDPSGTDDGPKGLPADHPLRAALEAGQDIGIDEDLDLSSIDQADLGWVPGHDMPGEGANKDKA